MQTIYTNHPGGILLHKHKAIKFDVVGERPATKYTRSAEKTKKKGKIETPEITAHTFWTLLLFEASQMK